MDKAEIEGIEVDWNFWWKILSSSPGFEDKLKVSFDKG
jgi:hypothetical protein